jgi:hypothetical protein
MALLDDSTGISQWYEQYIAADSGKLLARAPLILAVEDDELNVSLLEKRIEDLRSGIPVVGRFCLDCQNLFDNWPDLSDATTTHPNGTKCFPGTGADWKHTVARSFHTLRLEAAARNGCQFCTLIIQMLRDTQQLYTFRRIEARIESLGESAKTHLSLQNWGRNPQQLLSVNWPGKSSTTLKGGIGRTQRIVSGALRSDGERSSGPGTYSPLWRTRSLTYPKPLPTTRIEMSSESPGVGYRTALKITPNAMRRRRMRCLVGSCIPAKIRSASCQPQDGRSAVVIRR